MAITGIHAILYTHDAESDRAWLAEVLGYSCASRMPPHDSG